MHKNLGIVGALVAVAVLAVSSVAAASGRGGDHQDGDRGTIRVLSTSTGEAFVDVGKPDFSLGDAFVFSSKLTKHGKRVGHTGVVCTITSVKREESQCVGTARFRDGQITIQGLLAGESKVFAVAITGGTGAYDGAEGTLVVRDLPGNKERLTFRLH